MGFNREALRAGAQPNRTPTAAEKPKARRVAPGESANSNPMATAATAEMILPRRIPPVPPKSDSTTDSIRN